MAHLKPKYADIGTVSSGTLRTFDLLDAFTDTLAYLKRVGVRMSADHRTLLKEAQTMVADWDEDDDEPEGAGELVDDLQTALNDYAPPFTYFGTAEGDGAEFGYWPDLDALESAVHDGDAVRVDDLNDVPKGYSGTVMEVNDHGNVTVYEYTRGRSREVWSMV